MSSDSELWLLSRTFKNIQFLLNLLISDFFIFFTFIFSHPIYFLYFIFFSPYLFKLISFLSPLFITTSLFLLPFLTAISTVPPENNNNVDSSSFLISVYLAVVEGLQLRSKIDDDTRQELSCLEDFELFRIVFDDTTPPMMMIHVDIDNDDYNGKGCQLVEVLDPPSQHQQWSNKLLEVGNSGDSGAHCQLQEKLDVNVLMEEQEKRLEAFLQELDEFDGTVEQEKEGEKKIEATIEEEEEEEKEKYQQQVVTNGSKVELGRGKGQDFQGLADENVVSKEKDSRSSFSVESSRALEYINLGSYGSMRREKDWKRTLAGKLFEERHMDNNSNTNSNNGSGSSEGMDLLWETYEMESSNTKPKNVTKEKKNKKKHNDHHLTMKKCYPVKKDHQEDEEDDEEYVGNDGQLCCLQALKFSTGKMNMGMGKPSLVRISKAIKGFGWLHHVSSRHSKKVHIGDRF